MCHLLSRLRGPARRGRWIGGSPDRNSGESGSRATRDGGASSSTASPTDDERSCRTGRGTATGPRAGRGACGGCPGPGSGAPGSASTSTSTSGGATGIRATCAGFGATGSTAGTRSPRWPSDPEPRSRPPAARDAALSRPGRPGWAASSPGGSPGRYGRASSTTRSPAASASTRVALAGRGSAGPHRAHSARSAACCRGHDCGTSHQSVPVAGPRRQGATPRPGPDLGHGRLPSGEAAGGSARGYPQGSLRRRDPEELGGILGAGGEGHRGVDVLLQGGAERNPRGRKAALLARRASPYLSVGWGRSSAGGGRAAHSYCHHRWSADHVRSHRPPDRIGTPGHRTPRLSLTSPESRNALPSWRRNSPNPASGQTAKPRAPRCRKSSS